MIHLVTSVFNVDVVCRAAHDKPHGGGGFRQGAGTVLSKLELSNQVGEEEEHLRLGKSHTKALSAANKEWNEAFILGKASAIINESLRSEFFRVLPVGWVIQDVVEEGKDRSASRNIKVTNFCILEVHVRGANKVNSCDSHDLMDEGISVGQFV